MSGAVAAAGPQRIGVVGCGLMGAGLVEVCARAGLDVEVAVSSAASAGRGRRRVLDSLDRAVARGKLAAADRARALERITWRTGLEGMRDRELVVECVAEDEPAKLRLLAELDRTVTDPRALLASNTSSLSIGRLATATRRPGRVVGLHFFNPVPVMPLVEVVASALTEPDARTVAEGFVTGRLGKRVVRSPDRAGFVVNALLVPFLLEAIRMLESGHASAEDIDSGMTLGCAHPMGPLALADFTGLDTLAAVAGCLHAESADPKYQPPELLRELVAAGRLGRKTGRGFHRYSTQA